MYKYILDPKWVEVVRHFPEFANGGAQVSMRLKDGQVFGEILVSTSTWVVAMRGQEDLPFSLSDVVEIFQTETDKNPKRRGGWHLFNKR